MHLIRVHLLIGIDNKRAFHCSILNNFCPIYNQALQYPNKLGQQCRKEIYCLFLFENYNAILYKYGISLDYSFQIK